MSVGTPHRSGTNATEPDAAVPTQVYTIGYQGRTLSEVLRVVQVHSIQQVLDVRENAMSRKPGFTSAELKQALETIDVAYVHLPELGCSAEVRRALWRGAPSGPVLEDYRRGLTARPQAFWDLVHRAGSARSLLLCMERDPSRCHRAVLAERLRIEGVTVEDL